MSPEPLKKTGQGDEASGAFCAPESLLLPVGGLVGNQQVVLHAEDAGNAVGADAGEIFIALVTLGLVYWSYGHGVPR